MDNKKLFIGNLSYGTTAETILELFVKFGEITDSYRPQTNKGFMFVTYATEEQAQNAIEAMNGVEVEGREIVVNVAKPKEDRPRNRSFGGGGNSGGGYNRDRRGGGGDRGGRRDYNQDRY